MRRTIHKWFWAWDFEKEEKWLNEMSAKGLELVAVGIYKYTFEENSENSYTYRLELLENIPSNLESVSYIRFLEETGVEYIGSVMRWAYFRKKAAYGAFELYSDIDSKIKHYKCIITLFLLLIPVNISAAFLNLNNYIQNKHEAILACSIISFIATFVLALGIFKVSMKSNKLKKEQIIRE